jgi:ATP/maltotriose-dependent transcriptional regulator MalT
MADTHDATGVDFPAREIEVGREAYERREWISAHAAFSAARAALDPSDLWRLAVACYLTGRDDEYVRATQDAHEAHLSAGDRITAARCAFWLGFHFVMRGEIAPATGWFGRAARLLEGEPECAERGYLLIPVVFQQLHSGALEASLSTAERAVAIGQRCGDPDLQALALHLQGRALLRLARIEDGLALLDEAMVAVAADELSPPVTGLIYCSVIGACREVWAIRRAHEWTAALADWCALQPDMVPYAGECRVYRAEILHLRGAWREALEEARRAAEQLAAGPHARPAGLAHYQQAEVYRSQGELAAAEEAYRAASRFGREPQPGLALLRLAQGEKDAAVGAIRRALAETAGIPERARLLPATIEIMLEAGYLDEARQAHDELVEISRSHTSGGLETVCTEAAGAIELAAGNAQAAIAPLRRAWREWQALGAPYFSARARVLIARACRQLGDEDGAKLELDSARDEFDRLGASSDVARVDALAHGSTTRSAHGLTRRELEVLALLATGRTNRSIAADLSISEKTVARHVANMFVKLGLSSRAAATAYAYQHALVPSLHRNTHPS